MSKNLDTITEENIEKLNKLRALPRSSNIESRIAAIQALLGEAEVFRTIQNLRWPRGIVCPHCHSSHVVRCNPPAHATDQRSYYVCLQCQQSQKEDGDEQSGGGGFDDLTGLPIDSTLPNLIQYIQNWILCWYLIGFCSIRQIAQTLGLSLMQVMEMAELGTQITQLTSKEKLSLEYGFFSQYSKTKSQKEADKQNTEVLEAELHTRSESLSPFKPGPKSQK